jgi:hypothetical protein
VGQAVAKQSITSFLNLAVGGYSSIDMHFRSANPQPSVFRLTCACGKAVSPRRALGPNGVQAIPGGPWFFTPRSTGAVRLHAQVYITIPETSVVHANPLVLEM